LKQLQIKSVNKQLQNKNKQQQNIESTTLNLNTKSQTTPTAEPQILANPQPNGNTFHRSTKTQPLSKKSTLENIQNLTTKTTHLGQQM